MDNRQKAIAWWRLHTTNEEKQKMMTGKFNLRLVGSLTGREIEMLWDFYCTDKQIESILSDAQCMDIIEALHKFANSEDIELGLPQGETNTKTMINIIKNVIV